MGEIQRIEQEFMEAFNEVGDWMLQYEFLLQIAAELDPYPEEFKDPAHLVPGCQSKVWIYCRREGERLHIYGDSEALIIKGIIGVAILMFQDQKAEDIQNAEVHYIKETSIREQISTDRFRGVHSVIEQIQNFAEQN